jgi:MFS transporter, putative metabolite:H+ symporter
MNTPSADIASLTSRMDQLPLSRRHVVAMLVCAVGFGFDLFEIAIGGALAAVFSSSSDPMRATALGWLLSSVYIGAIVGAPLLGWLAERHGRKRLLGSALLVLAFTSAAAAFSPDVFWLTFSRALSGLALGAFPPLMFAYLTDILPARHRGRCLMLVVAMASLGAPCGVLVLRAAQTSQPFGLEAWRLALLCGGIGAGIAGMGILRLMESPRWLAHQGRSLEAEEVLRALAASKVVAKTAESAPEAATARHAKDAVGNDRSSAALHPTQLVRLASVYLLSPWSTVAFPLLVGAALVKRGIPLQQSLLFVAVSSFGPALGALLAAPILDRFERRTVLCSAAIAMTACCAWFSSSSSSPSILVSILSFSFAASIYISALSIYGSELFVTQKRAIMSSWAWAFNRVGAAMAPVALVPLLSKQGEASILAVIAMTAILSVALIMTLPRGHAGRPVN